MRSAAGAVVLVAMATLVGCGRDGSGSATSTAAAGTVHGEVRVLAASSLTGAFGDLERSFENEFAGVDVVLSFAGSAHLVQQVEQGAPADVVVTADEATMRRLVDVGALRRPTVIARNRLALLVEKGNPLAVRGLRDVGVPGRKLILCNLQVPCGRLGREALDRAGVEVEPVSYEENVKGVVAKVTLGEADVGIVYESDVLAAAGKADGVPLDVDDADLEAVYPLALASDPPNPTAAAAWRDHVLGDVGRIALRAAGLRGP